MDHQTILQIIITLLAMPIILFFFQRFVNKSDETKKQEETNWRASVTDMFARLEKKVTTYCQDNHKEHGELYENVNSLNTKVSSIETIHHQRGCDQPYRRD